MTYRDDLGAAQGRIRQLEDELGQARQTIEGLQRQLADEQQKQKQQQQQKKQQQQQPRPSTPDRPAQTRRLGRLTYKAPPTYVPLFRLFGRAISAALERYPRRRPLDTPILALWLIHVLLYWPLFTLLYRPLYFVSLVVVVVPVTALLTLVASVVVTPFLILSRIRLGDAPVGEPRWIRGEFTGDEAATALWVLMSCCMQPLLLLYTGLLTARDD